MRPVDVGRWMLESVGAGALLIFLIARAVQWIPVWARSSWRRLAP